MVIDGARNFGGGTPEARSAEIPERRPRAGERFLTGSAVSSPSGVQGPDQARSYEFSSRGAEPDGTGVG